MAHTYYARWTLVHPNHASKLDPRMGIVIAETATTGRFLISDITWDTMVNPNSDSMTAYGTTGEMKIQEPLAMSLYDYIRAAAFQVGVENHLDARFLLEIEILAEDFLAEKNKETPFKYIWPIMILASDVKGSLSDKGSEYSFKFVHMAGHSQTDMVQPIKETLTIDAVEKLQDYFTGLQKELERREFKYAEGRQKAGSGSAPGGNNPAASDQYHDEYHFILEPRLEKFTLTSDGKSGKGVQGAWTNVIPWVTKQYSVTARPGTTIIQQINTVLSCTNEIAELLPGKLKPMSSDAAGSSERSAKNIKDQAGEIYQFFRVETYNVHKAYDYIRGRYAVKHIFLIYLADQPNMYHYPDEIDILNQLSNKDKVQMKLNKYIKNGLLQKIYYYNYTGLNTDILRVDLQFNQAYMLPSFPVLWADRGQTGPGAMNLQNYSKQINPFAHSDNMGVRNAVNQLRHAASKMAQQVREMLNEKGELKDNSSENRQRYKALKEYQAFYEKELQKRETELSAREKEASKNLNTINSRTDLLNSLKRSYAEDINFKEILDRYLEINYPGLRPRMEPDNITPLADITKIPNQQLMEKIFSVQLAPKDLVQLELEIIGDPYWLGVPNLLTQGKSGLDKIELPSKNGEELRAKINKVMPKIDTEWNNKKPVWGDYGVAQWYKGSSLIYFYNQIPDSEFTEDDMLKFNPNDQIQGIYVVVTVTNEFKNGKWTQKLKTIKDLTIPSHALPRGLSGNLTLEEFIYDVEQSKVDPTKQAVDLAQKENANRDKQMSQNNLQPATNARDSVVLKPQVQYAMDELNESLAKTPPPTVNDPVTVANQKVAEGMSKQQAYEFSKTNYISQVSAYTNFMEAANKKAYESAGVTDYKPYSAATMSAMIISKSRAGGLEDWKSGQTVTGPSAAKNPAGIGYDSATKTYPKYPSFQDGIKAANDYFNYGQGVKSIEKQGPNRLLLPSDYSGQDLNYLNNKLKTKGAG
jgi:hypothetical protein